MLTKIYEGKKFQFSFLVIFSRSVNINGKIFIQVDHHENDVSYILMNGEAFHDSEDIISVVHFKMQYREIPFVAS